MHQSLSSDSLGTPPTIHTCHWGWCRLNFRINADLVRHVVDDHVMKSVPIRRRDISIIQRAEEGHEESFSFVSSWLGKSNDVPSQSVAVGESHEESLSFVSSWLGKSRDVPSQSVAVGEVKSASPSQHDASITKQSASLQPTTPLPPTPTAPSLFAPALITPPRSAQHASTDHDLQPATPVDQPSASQQVVQSMTPPNSRRTPLRAFQNLSSPMSPVKTPPRRLPAGGLPYPTFTSLSSPLGVFAAIPPLPESPSFDDLIATSTFNPVAARKAEIRTSMRTPRKDIQPDGRISDRRRTLSGGRADAASPASRSVESDTSTSSSKTVERQLTQGMDLDVDEEEEETDGANNDGRNFEGVVTPKHGRARSDEGNLQGQKRHKPNPPLRTPTHLQLEPSQPAPSLTPPSASVSHVSRQTWYQPSAFNYIRKRKPSLESHPIPNSALSLSASAAVQDGNGQIQGGRTASLSPASRVDDVGSRQVEHTDKAIAFLTSIPPRSPFHRQHSGGSSQPDGFSEEANHFSFDYLQTQAPYRSQSTNWT